VNRWSSRPIAATGPEASRRRNPPLTEDISVDVAILARLHRPFRRLLHPYRLPHKRVALLEAKGCGNGASDETIAMVCLTRAYMDFSSNPAIDKQIYDLTAANHPHAGETQRVDRHRLRVGDQWRSASAQYARRCASGKAYVQQARSLGMPVEFWEKQRLTQEIGTEVYEAAFFDPNGGHVHPMKLVHVFKTAAQAARAEVYENTTVAHIEEGREHLLHTTGDASSGKIVGVGDQCVHCKTGILRELDRARPRIRGRHPALQ